MLREWQAGNRRMIGSEGRDRGVSAAGTEDRVQGLGGAVRAAGAGGVRRAGGGGGSRQRRDLGPLPAVAARGRARAVVARVVRGGGGAHVAGADRHVGAHADVPLQPGGARPDVRDVRAAVPGAGDAGRGHRGGAQRDRGVRPGVAGVQGAVRAAARVDPADAGVVDGGGGVVRGRVLPHGRGHDLRPARAAGAGVRGRGRPGRREVRGPFRRRVHLHLGQRDGALHRQADPGRGGGGRRGRA